MRIRLPHHREEKRLRLHSVRSEVRQAARLPANGNAAEEIIYEHYRQSTKSKHGVCQDARPEAGAHPTPKIAAVTYMDPRLSDLPKILGLPHADLDVIRSGGPAVTEDVLGELVVSTRVLGTTEIMLLNHTGCGFTTFTDEELNAKLSALTGDASPAPMRFFSYKDPEENTREQIAKVRAHPWIAREVSVRGFVFDVETGLLSEVQQVPQNVAA